METPQERAGYFGQYAEGSVSQAVTDTAAQLSEPLIDGARYLLVLRDATATTEWFWIQVGDAEEDLTAVIATSVGQKRIALNAAVLPTFEFVAIAGRSDGVAFLSEGALETATVYLYRVSRKV